MKKLVYLMLFANVIILQDKQVKEDNSVILFGENALKTLESNEKMDYETFAELSDSIKVLFSCNKIPYYRIDQIDDIIEYSGETTNPISYYVLKCQYQNVFFSIQCYTKNGIDQLIIDSIIDNNTILYMKGINQLDYKRKDPDVSRKKSLSLLQEKCNFTAGNASKIMNEIEILFDIQNIDFYDFKSIDKVEQLDDLIVLSAMSLFNDEYRIVLDCTEKPIIYQIINCDGNVLFQLCHGDNSVASRERFGDG